MSDELADRQTSVNDVRNELVVASSRCSLHCETDNRHDAG